LIKIDDVAVIDEVQMMRDPQRGWAWTRALLGKMKIFS
jgi:ATP-dependent RNA helicase SUPV3L1/SUV3